MPSETQTGVDSPALLALEDGTVLEGYGIGAAGETVGEVVFNTAMTGYQEILTDPSYASQIVTLTYPHIGNVGANPEDEEAERIFAAGLVIRDLSPVASSWRAREPLQAYLSRRRIVGLAGIDTRRLTRLLRTRGAQRGALLAGPVAAAAGARERAVEAARAFPGLVGMDLAREVTTRRPYLWREGAWRLGHGHAAPAASPSGHAPWRVVAFDFGVKRNILRLLIEHGCEVRVVPADTPAGAVRALAPDGVFLSNGPGDPEPCGYAIAAIRELVDSGIPTFGICLGHQLLALASGAATVKMKFGHHGANHPVKDLRTGAVLITSQNHGFAVDEASLPPNVVATHRSLFDGTLQGLERTDRPAFGFQGHPEASPGPHDVRHLFARFVELMRAHRNASQPAVRERVAPS